MSTRQNIKLVKAVMISSIITGLLLASSIFSADEGGGQVSESDKLKREIRDLLGPIKEKNEKAQKLFMEAKVKADSLKQEAEQKLKFLGETINKAKKSKIVSKTELNKAIKLNKEAKGLFKENKYAQVIEKVNEALGHISKVPVVTLTVTPQLFSPGGTVDNVLTITLKVFSVNKEKSWVLVIKKKEEGQEEEIEIKTWTGDGKPTKPVTWDGKLEGKIALDSASSYFVELSVVDEKKGVGKSSQVKFKTDIFVIEHERGKVINISSITFDYFKYDLKDEYKGTVEMVHDFILGYPGYSIVVEGHSDSSGRATKNKILSEKRAKSVVDYLIELGMDKERTRESGLGEALPITYEKVKMGLNRRVAFILLKTEDDIKKYNDFINKLDFEKNVQMKTK